MKYWTVYDEDGVASYWPRLDMPAAIETRAADLAPHLLAGTCATCRHWDPSEPPHPTRRDPAEQRRRCRALSSPAAGALETRRQAAARPLLAVPLELASGSPAVAIYTVPGWGCPLWREILVQPVGCVGEEE